MAPCETKLGIGGGVVEITNTTTPDEQIRMLQEENAALKAELYRLRAEKEARDNDKPAKTTKKTTSKSKSKKSE